MENDKHITLDREYFERAVKRAKHCGAYTPFDTIVFLEKEIDSYRDTIEKMKTIPNAARIAAGFEPVTQLEAVKNENKIVITTDGTTTRAALYEGHKLIREAKAICSKDDTFDFETGAKIAFERLTAKPAEPKPKKALKPLNTKIFVLDGDDILKSSHIYEVKNGKIRAFIGNYPKKGILYNMNDVVNYLKPQSLRNSDENYDSNGVKFSVYDNMKQITVMEVKEG